MPSTGSEPGRPTYRFAFSWEGPYGRAVKLVRAHGLPGAVLDLGCGYGAVAEVLRDEGHEYVGCDIDAEAVSDLEGRGFEAHVVDLATTDGLAGRLANLLQGRRVGALLLLDIIEHVPDPGSLLGELAELSEFLGGDGPAPVLVTSIPNVSHLDLALKLVAGRWDVTQSGLLDRTHLQMFTEQRVDADLGRFGWRECGREDVYLEHSDQWFPPDHPYLVEGGPVHDHIAALRAAAGPNMKVNQFVRAYAFGAVADDAPAPAAPSAQPFLTVLTRTQGLRPGLLAETLTCLAAQTVADLEVILLVHSEDEEVLSLVREVVASFEESFAKRVRLRQVTGVQSRGGPLNVGLRLARGRYVAFLDDDDFVTADWAEAFMEAAERAPGQVVRSVCYSRHVRRPSEEEEAMGEVPVTRTRPLPEFGERFDAAFHLAVNTTPIISFAVPRALVTELGLYFDEEMEVCEDWDFLIRCALVVGVAETGRITSLYQRWVDDGSTSAVSPEVWGACHAWLLEKLDASPLLLPAGMARELATLVADPGLVAERENRIASLERELEETRASLSEAQHKVRAAIAEAEGRIAQLEAAHNEVLSSEFWRMTGPLRAAVNVVKRNKPEQPSS